MLLKDTKRIGSMKLSTISYFIVIGFGGQAIGTLAFTKAFMLINPSLVILLQKLQPIVAISLAHILLGEKIKKEFILWAAVALIGGFLISSVDILPGLSHLDFKVGFLSNKAIWGYTLALIAVGCWGASTVFGKKLSMQGFDEIQIMGGRFILGLTFMTFYLYYRFGGLSLHWSAATYGKLLVIVFISGLAGMYFYYKGLKLISARACALAELFFPFSAVVINWVFLDAKLLPIQILGAVLIVIASTVIQLKKY